MAEGIKVCLVGYGYWGKNLLRNIIGHPHVTKTYLCDTDIDRLNAAQKIYPNIETSVDVNDFLGNPEIDAFVIATPTSTHYELVKMALMSDKHVMVEKPFVTSLKEAKFLCKLAESKHKVILIDHTFVYNPVVRQLKSYMSESYLGKINYIDSTRINLGIYQEDTNVLWDLASHDISIINYLIDERPVSVRAIGKVHPKHKREDIAYLFMYYPSDLMVQINASWASPVKMRKMIIGGENKLIIYDDIEPSNKLIIYDYEHHVLEGDNKSKLIDYRLGNITIPKYELTEPLNNVIDDFVTSVLKGKQPLSNGHETIEIVYILENAEKSLQAGGELIHLDYSETE